MTKRKEVISRSEMVAIQNTITQEMEFAKVSVIVEKDVPKYKNEPFTILFQIANSLIIGDMPLIDCKLVLYLMANSQYGNIIDKTLKEMASDLKFKDSNYIQKSLKRLEDLKIVLRSKHPSDNRRFVYMLNPKQSWKGSVKDRVKSLSSLDKNQLILFPENNDDAQAVSNQKQALPNNFNFLNQVTE